MKKDISCDKTAHLLYLTPDERNQEEGQLVQAHIASCPTCRKIQDTAMAIRQQTIRLQPAEQHFPEINPLFDVVVSRWDRTLYRIRLVSSIASVLLLFLFLSEQATSVRKISRLERRIEATPPTEVSGMIDRITLIQSAMSAARWQEISRELPGQASNLTPRELSRMKFLITKGLLPVQPADLARAGWIRNPVLTKRIVVSNKTN